MLVDTILLPRFLILELVVACHYLDYTQAFRVFGEGGAKNDGLHHDKEDDSRNTKEKLITYVENAKSQERHGGAPKEGGSKNHLKEAVGKQNLGNLKSGNEESLETMQL